MFTTKKLGDRTAGISQGTRRGRQD